MPRLAPSACFVFSVLLVGKGASQEAAEFGQWTENPSAEIIVLNLTGELANAYALKTGEAGTGGESRTIATRALVTGSVDPTSVQVEHSKRVKRESAVDRLVTLTARVERTAIKSFVRTVYQGQFTFSGRPSEKHAGSFADGQPAEQPTVRARHFSIPSLSLSNLEGVKLRTWTVESEVGE